MSNKTFWRFCLVGIVNTLIDVPTFVALHTLGLTIFFANLISTSLALIASLFLNYRYTFKSRRLSTGRIALYFIVTLAGIWLLQPIIIKFLLDANNHGHYTAFIINRLGHANQINSLFAKLGSLVFSLLWNYAWYNKVVFKDEPAKEILSRSIENI